jgi:Flp pilus assembly protein TadB
MNITLMLAGGAVGGGLAAVAYGLRQPRLSLAGQIDAVRQPPSPPLPTADRLLRALTRPLARLELRRAGVASDLAVMGRDPTRYLGYQLGMAALGLLAPTALVTLLNLAGIRVGWMVPLWVGLLLAAGGIVVVAVDLHDDAEDRRLLMRHTLAALLDIIPPALKAGAGVQQALTDAAQVASGWAADRIRDALQLVAVQRIPLWQPLAELGREIGVVELQQLASTLRLAEHEGTRIRDALTDRGDALDEQLSAELEARAESATERMSMPLMLLTSIFLLFLVYPGISLLHG